MRIAIMGAGSIGTIFGAYVAKAGYDVVLIDAYPEHVKALNETGAHVVGKVDFVQKVHAILPTQMEGVYDLIFYMAKQTFNDTAIPQIAAHIDENSTVCVCQNGIPEYAVSEVIGPERVIGATVGWGATFRGPGCSELTTDTTRLNFGLGSFTGEVNDRVLKAKKVLESMGGTAEVSDNLIGARWTKLLMNATFSGLSTALGTTFGGVLDSDDAMMLILKDGKECLDAAAAAGVTLEPYDGYDFYTAFRMGNKKTNAESIALIRKIWAVHYNLTASMAQDILKGRKCEIFDINGVVCKTGDKYGVPTPINDKIVEIVSGIQDGKYKYDPANMKYFEEFLKQ
ncbi:MAG: ketopantoate reductase family protein [Eubacterium sp.]